MDKDLSSDISKIKNPEQRVNVRSFILAIIALSGVAYFLYTKVDNSDKVRIQEKDIIISQQDLELINCNKKYDSLVLKNFGDKLETIKRLEDVIHNQEQQKKQLRNIK